MGKKKININEIQAYLRILPLLANLITIKKENKNRKKEIKSKELESKTNTFFKIQSKTKKKSN